MKKLNIFLMILLILLIAFCVYFYIGGTLKPYAAAATAPAAEHPDAYESICRVIESHSAPEQFAELSGEIGDYTLVDVGVTLANPGLFDAEWLEISLTPVQGDVAVYSLTGNGSDVPARGSAQINLKLITTDTSPARQYAVNVSYYVRGMKRTVSLTA